MVGNDIVGIHQMPLLVIFHLLSRCRPSIHQREKNGNYGVSNSSQQGEKWKLWRLRPLLCTLSIFERVQQSDHWSYLNIVIIDLLSPLLATVNKLFCWLIISIYIFLVQPRSGCETVLRLCVCVCVCLCVCLSIRDYYITERSVRWYYGYITERSVRWYYGFSIAAAASAAASA